MDRVADAEPAIATLFAFARVFVSLSVLWMGGA
jgi:hypothetical protein